jgi:small multidrug resistance pump
MEAASHSGWKLYLCVLLILLAETTALSLLKQYSLSGHIFYMLGGLACYTLVSLLLVQSFRYEGMGIVNVLWSACSVVLVVAAGVILFGEHVGNVELFGISMVVSGV